MLPINRRDELISLNTASHLIDADQHGKIVASSLCFLTAAEANSVIDSNPEERTMKISEVMHKGVETVPPDASITAIAAKMRDKDIGALPVGADGKLIGMITDRDLALRVLAAGRETARLTARDVMTSAVVSCRDTDEASHAAEVMEHKQIRRLPVLDRNDKMVGMVSLGDISHLMPGDVAAEVLKSVSAHHV